MVSWRRPLNKKYLTIVVGFVSIFVFSSLFAPTTVEAAELTNRSLTLIGTSTTGGSEPGAVVNDLFSFETATAATIGSIDFVYCTTADGTCTQPTGLVTTSATLASQSGTTGFTINNTATDAPSVTNSSGASIAASTQLTFQLDGITNPTTANQSFYVRITTYNTSGTAVDSGNVAASTANQIVLSGTMPESLVFCTGATVSETSGIPNCSTATSGDVNFTSLFSPTAVATASSQMAASTNANHGYVISVNGNTLTSGSSSIDAMTTDATSANGTSQFGMNLMANTTATSTPTVGADVTPAYDTSTGDLGQPLTGYNTADEFEFVSGNDVASSTGPSNAQLYTVSYIVNVPGDQAAGSYTTTLTYICTPTF